MNERSSHDKTPTDPRLDFELDRLCEEFEAAWRAGIRPRVEDFVAQAPEPLRVQLWSEFDTLVAEMQRTPVDNEPGTVQRPVDSDDQIATIANSRSLKMESMTRGVPIRNFR